LLAISGGIAGWRLRWQKRVLLAQQTTAIERERGRIARDLHDDLGATLTGFALELEAARGRGRAEGAQLATLASEARTLANDLRELTWTTNPRCDNVGSLGVFLGELSEKLCNAAGLDCKLTLPPTNNVRTVPAHIRHQLLVLTKESLMNVAKHARAKTVWFQLAATQTQLRLTIRDDGCGFDEETVNGGTGLENLRERMQQAGGSFTVTSRRLAGTIISVSIPLNETANH
jgi:signal transduction histidine kinase